MLTVALWWERQRAGGRGRVLNAAGLSAAVAIPIAVLTAALLVLPSARPATLLAQGVPAAYAYDALPLAYAGGGGAVAADLGLAGAELPALTSAQTAAAQGIRNERSRPLVLPGALPGPLAAGVTVGTMVIDPPLFPVGSAIPTAADLTLGQTGGPAGAPYDPQVLIYIHQAFPADQWDNAARVGACESGLRSVVSKPNDDGTRDWGVFQLNDGGTLQGLLSRLGAAPDDLALSLDPRWNVAAAARLYAERGWAPWTCAYKLHLTSGLYKN